VGLEELPEAGERLVAVVGYSKIFGRQAGGDEVVDGVVACEGEEVNRRRSAPVFRDDVLVGVDERGGFEGGEETGVEVGLGDDLGALVRPYPRTLRKRGVARSALH